MSGFWVARGKDGHYEVMLPANPGVKGICGPTVLKLPVLKPGERPVFVEAKPSPEARCG